MGGPAKKKVEVQYTRPTLGQIFGEEEVEEEEEEEVEEEEKEEIHSRANAPTPPPPPSSLLVGGFPSINFGFRRLKEKVRKKIRKMAIIEKKSSKNG